MRRKQKTPSTSSSARPFLYTDVQALLAEIQKRQLILLEDNPGHIEIWSPGVKLPKPLQRSVYQHRHTLVERIACHDVRVCPSPRLHKRYHRGDVCRACERLATNTRR